MVQARSLMLPVCFAAWPAPSQQRSATLPASTSVPVVVRPSARPSIAMQINVAPKPAPIAEVGATTSFSSSPAVAATASTPACASDSAPRRRNQLSADALALCATMPSLPPFTGGHEWTHTDPLLLSRSEQLAVSSVAAAASSASSSGSAARPAPAASATLHLMGYDLQFVQPPDQDLVCVICSLVCRDAVETSCSHIFCSSCLHRWLQQKSECVTCRTSVHVGRDVHASGFIRRKVLGLGVRCVNESACEWTGELRYMSTHLRKDCAMQKIIHAMQAFVYAKPDRASSYASSSSSVCASSSSSSNATAAAVAAAFPPALMSSSSMSLGALYRLASCVPPLHFPSTNEAVPFCGLAESAPLRQHWASGGTKPPLGVHGEDFMAREPHRVCNDRCGVAPEAPADWIEGFDVSSDVARGLEIREWILSALVSARRQYIDVLEATKVYLQGLPVRVLLAFLAAKGLDQSSAVIGAVEKNEIVEACMDHRMEPDKPSASGNGNGGGNGNGQGSAFGSRRQSDDPHAASSFYPAPRHETRDSWGSFNDANLNAALLMQISSSLGLSLAAAAAAADPQMQHAAMHGGAAAGRNHFDQHAAMHNLAMGRAMHQPGAASGAGGHGNGGQFNVQFAMSVNSSRNSSAAPPPLHPHAHAHGPSSAHPLPPRASAYSNAGPRDRQASNDIAAVPSAANGVAEPPEAQPSPSSGGADVASSSSLRNSVDSFNPSEGAALAAAMLAHAHQHRLAAEVRFAQLQLQEAETEAERVAAAAAQLHVETQAQAQQQQARGGGGGRRRQASLPTSSTASSSPASPTTVPLFVSRQRSGSQPSPQSATRADVQQPPSSEAEQPGATQACCSIQ